MCEPLGIFKLLIIYLAQLSLTAVRFTCSFAVSMVGEKIQIPIGMGWFSVYINVPPKVRKRYVDDSFCVIKRNAVDSFHNTLNAIDQHISFTIEEENNNQIALIWKDRFPGYLGYSQG